MCSSKIIRKGAELQMPFTLEPLGGGLPEQSADVFRPINLGGADEPAELAVTEPELAPPAPPVMFEEDAHRLIREARAEGFRDGRAQAEAEFAKLTEALGQALLATGSLRGQLMHEAEDDLLKLAVLIARKVTLREFACDPGIMVGLVQSALELAADGGGAVVRLNPEEYEVLVACRQFEQLLRDHPNISLKADAAVGRAGCLVETVRGNIDAGVEAQLDAILRRLTDEKSERREEGDD